MGNNGSNTAVANYEAEKKRLMVVLNQRPQVIGFKKWNKAHKRYREIMKLEGKLRMPIVKSQQVTDTGNEKVVEITERKCSDKIQPRIKVGQRYYVDGQDTLKDGTKVLILVDWDKSKHGKLKTVRCNAKRFSWKGCSEQMLRDSKIQEDAKKTTQQLMDAFTFDEHMQIALVPLVIIQCAWTYADRVLAECGREKISWTKDLCKAVRHLHGQYDDFIGRDLDIRHRFHTMEQTKKFISECSNHFFIMEMTIQNEIMKSAPQAAHLAMRTFAFMAMIFCKYYEKQIAECDRMIEQRTHIPQTPSIAIPQIDALSSCMDAFTGTVQIDMDKNVELCIRAFANDLKRIKFEVIK